MSPLATGLIVLVAVLHFWFLILEMFLWTRPFGMKTFGMTSEQASSTKVLAFNQGLYNGFLAAGLVTGLLIADPGGARFFEQFFLVCVVVAGVVGGLTANRRIFFIQAVPAIAAWLALTL